METGRVAVFSREASAWGEAGELDVPADSDGVKAGRLTEANQTATMRAAINRTPVRIYLEREGTLG